MISNILLNRVRPLTLFPQISFNDVRSLAPLQFHPSLQILDVEANQIEDIEEIEYLKDCYDLVELTVEDNPIGKTATTSSSSQWRIIRLVGIFS
jgi:Leucine-rich repeat (LRR) protein